MKNVFATGLSWGITSKLVAMFVVFGVLPMGAVGVIAFDAADDMKDAIGMRVLSATLELSDKIDRNLFERYGDVQAFGYNEVLHQHSHWYDPTPQNPISQAMNKYAATYGIYDLMIVVDTKGKVIAANYTDSMGKPIHSRFLFEKNYSEAPWFKALAQREFTTKHPFTAPGNDTATGTYVEDAHLDPDVAKALGTDGYVLGFSAPVYDDAGEVIAYWSNRMGFGAVERMVQDSYENLKSLGFAGAELSLLDGSGRLLVDYDPVTSGALTITRDFTVLTKFNLAENGVEAAKAAVNGESGFRTAHHVRKKIDQVSGYTHSKGALGFPGMNWSLLIRIPSVEAAAESNALQMKVVITGIVCLSILLPLGWWVGRKGAQQVVALQKVAQRMTEGDYAVRVKLKSQDEIGRLGLSFNEMAGQIEDNIVKGREFEGKMAAISKAEMIIEFQLDGTIITANENFCQTMGYSLEEIKGQHHSMFADPEEAKSPAYHAFWAKLNRGEFDAGVYRRLGRGGKEVWLQASYNPILDANNKPYKVVKFASDITGQKKAQVEVERLIEAAAKGELEERIATEEFEGSSRELAENFNELLAAVDSPLREARTVLSAVANGDLSTLMIGQYQGQFDEIKNSVNEAIQNLRGIVQAVRDGAKNVSKASNELLDGNKNLSERTSTQASALEETSASMEEMTSTIKQNADNAKQANQLAAAAREVAEKGGTVTSNAVNAMDAINKSSKKIADITNVIDELAFQTNLLALNAAVEAARAGEQGRGFAVVASEVRNLAQRSATAAKEIKTLINESVQNVDDGSELVNQSGRQLEEIVGSVKRVTDIISEISAASQEQATGIEQINQSVVQMDQSVQQNAALVEHASSASQSLKQHAYELMERVASFKITEERTTSEHRHEGNMKSEPEHLDMNVERAGITFAKPSESTKSAAKPTPPLASVGKNGNDSAMLEDNFFQEF
ncbi:MAG: methyl-accepting chemotaxis protein [Nitrospirales bacterium]|nr:PAS domain S-box protein [Nitrospira sp.]MDR4501400.1 methyl-accepting chemotaxis protein [Nitrospirales bacterium]